MGRAYRWPVDAFGWCGPAPTVTLSLIGVNGDAPTRLRSRYSSLLDEGRSPVSKYDMGRAMRQGLNDTVSEDQRQHTLQQVSEQRWAELDGAERRMVPGTPVELTEQSTAVDREFFDYYRTPRGEHPRSTTAFTFTSNAAMNGYYPFTQIAAISPRPLLFITSEKAHSRYFSEDAFARAAEPKELVIVPGAGHVDLYDRVELIPFDTLTDFFTENLE